MAASSPDFRLTRVVAALLCCLAAGTAPAAGPELSLPRPTKGPIDLVAASSDFDYKNNRLHFQQVRITQGDMKVEAQEASATGLNFENSEWTLRGNVRITVPDGELTSSDAVVTFRGKQIAIAVVHGSPAEFQQKLKNSEQVAKGRAQSIEYDVAGATVRLTGEAWLTDGDNAIQGDTLIYDVAGQRVRANPGSTVPGGVHITINPQSQEKNGGQGKDTQPKQKPDAPQ